MAGALDGIRVLDLSRFIAGPFCTMLLADMGAEVIKVEKAGKGDDARSLGPFQNGHSLYFTSYNRNKKSVTVDFRSKKGQALLHRLIQTADVLVENFRPGSMEAMGLDKATLEALNPRLVVTSVSGYGQYGPYRDHPAFDCIAQAASGLMSLTGKAGDGPMLTGTYIGDFLGAMYAVYGTLTALISREKTGLGQSVDIALTDSLFSILATAMPMYMSTGQVQQPNGNRDKVSGPANLFKAKDGDVYMHAGTDPLFSRFAQLIGQPQLPEDPRFCSVGARMDNIDQIEQIAADWFAGHTAEEAAALLAKAGIPASIVNTMAQVVKDPQMLAREQIVKTEYPGMGEVYVSGITAKLSETPGSIYARPPQLGEHNRQVYGQLLGLTEAEIEELCEQGVI